MVGIPIGNALFICTCLTMWINPKPPPANLSFYLTLVVVIYLTDRCFTPPNPGPTISPLSPLSSASSSRSSSPPPPSKSKSKSKSHPPSHAPNAKCSIPLDRVEFATTPLWLWSRRLSFYGIGLYHAFLSFTYRTETYKPGSYHAYLCPHPERLNRNLFTWSRNSLLCVCAVLIFAPIRLLAFKQLGKSFTFRLSEPHRLVTGGLYKWVQHPSYTANIFILISNGLLIERPDGVLACWVPERVVDSRLWKVAALGLVVFGVMATRVRVKDEEGLLKRVFGKEWEVWHSRTKRFIPGVF